MTPAEIFEAAQDALDEQVLNVPSARAIALARRLRAIAIELEWIAGHDTFHGRTVARESDLQMKTIIETVCIECNVTALQIRGRGKSQRLANARHLAVYLARELTDLSFPVLGDYFKRDHTTIMHSHQLITGRYKANIEYMRHIRRLSADIVATVESRTVKQSTQLNKVAA